MTRARRKLLPAFLLAGALFFAGTGVASADNCSDAQDTQNCMAAIGAVAGIAAAAAAAGAVLATKPFTPRDSGECGAELAYLDGVLNGALADLERGIEGRNQVRFKKLEYEVKASEIRTEVIQGRILIGELKDELLWVGIKEGGYNGGKFVATKILPTAVMWAIAAKLAILTNTWPGFIAGWGIRAWRVSIIADLVNTYWAEIKLGFNGIYELTHWGTKMEDAYSSMYDDVLAGLDDKARSFDAELDKLKADIEGASQQVYEVWERRESTYQHCLRSGNLPPGTWHRSRPHFVRDEEGAITSTF